jgi:heterotetrameric sarcosine oxidase delta subunit
MRASTVTRIVCPYCGSRKLTEFQVHKTLPEQATGPITRLYERVDRGDVSLEHWQHVDGCRAWLRVRRNASTGEVRDVAVLGGVPV